MIATEGLTKRYEDGVLALDRLDLEVGSGSIYCLLGANGAGKTTAINLLLGFIDPTAGRAAIDGIDVAADPLGAKRRVAYLADSVQLYGNFTARQNLRFFAGLAGHGGLNDGDCDRAMRRAGLPERAFDQRVGGFSKGMRQKLGIAICVLKDAPALVLDEPLSGLDPKAAADFSAALAALRDAGKAILMSTHDIFRARELADTVGIMKDGLKVAEHTAAELRGRDLEEVYLAAMGEETAADRR